jgi:hypothetical protein
MPKCSTIALPITDPEVAAMRRILLAGLLLLFASASVVAHHGLSSEYDRDKVLTITGKLMEIDWRNPHPYFYIDVTGPNGQVTRWKLGTATPNMLVRFPGGWTRDKVFKRLNDEITVKGWLSKDGTNHLYGDTLTFSDGSKMQLGIGLGNV